MHRTDAGKYAKEKLNEYGLTAWGVRLTTDINSPFLGMCDHRTKSIILNAHHCDIHDDVEVKNTILHEVAHAIVGNGHAHDDVWAAKAKEIGCHNTMPCSHLNIPEHVVDGIRSGATVEVTMEEVVHIIRTPKFTVTRLQEKCTECGKPAIEMFSSETVDTDGNQCRIITLECFHVVKKIIPKTTPFESLVSNGWKPEVQACIHDWNKNQCMICGQFRLYDFQVKGARFAEIGLAIQKGVGIFDDMGLGKTMQGAALPILLPKLYTPVLIVTKSAIKYQWFAAFITWGGPQFLAQILSTSRDPIMPGLKVYIVPYDLLRRMKPEKIAQIGAKLVILDECQQIKNPDSSRTQEVRKLVKDPNVKVIELSGTPWKNRGSEYFPALNLLDPTKFYSNQAFLDTWVEYYYVGNKRKMGGIRNIPKFKQYTESLIIRREYEEVMEEFPEINRMKLPIQLDDLSQTVYDDEESEFVAWYNEAIIGGEEDNISGIEILAQMARMRHITGLAKIPATLSFIEEFVSETQRKLVVFVHHIDVAQLLEKQLLDTSKDTNPEWYELAELIRDESVKILRYGSEHTGKEAGINIQNDFNATKRCILIASTLACGEGLNLQTCSDSILHERQWNPQNEDQATPGRFRRIGQVAKVISITTPEAVGSIDEELDSMVAEKRLRFHKVMNQGEMPVWSQTDFAKELAERIVKKHKLKMGNKPKSNIAAKVSKANLKRNQPTFVEVTF